MPVVPANVSVPEPSLVKLPVPLLRSPLTVTFPLFTVVPTVRFWLALVMPPLRVSDVPVFAVISEAFFEDPEETRRRYPDVYDQLRLFYRQDPAG